MSNIGLSMIVKNEAARIERCLNSVKPHIACWSIFDTGSKDDTEKLVHKSLAGLPGEIGHVPFTDFSTTRNVALDAACKMQCDYVLLVDADHELKVEKQSALSQLTADAYSLIQVRNNPANYRYPNVRLVRRNSGIRYIGVTHEYLNVLPRSHAILDDGIWLLDHNDSNRPDKYTLDLALLAADYERDPNNERTVFYLARTHDGLGHLNEAIKFFEKRVALGGWPEEVYISLLTLARIKNELGHKFADVYQTYQRAIQIIPARAEAWYGAAGLCRQAMCWHEAYELARCGVNLSLPKDSLFGEDWVYRWGLLDEYVVAAYWSGHLSEASVAIRALLQCPDLDNKERARIKKNAELICKGAREQMINGVGNGRQKQSA